MKFALWKRNPAPQTTPKVEVLTVNPLTIRLAEWRSNADLVTQSRNLANQELFKAQLEVLKNENPALAPLWRGAQATDRIAQQARIEGYVECLRNLQLFCSYRKLPQPLEATFEPPELVEKA